MGGQCLNAVWRINPGAGRLNSNHDKTTMNKTIALILMFCILAVSACSASKPVPAGLMMSAPGENGAYTDLDN